MSDALERAARICGCLRPAAGDGERCRDCGGRVVPGLLRHLAVQQLYLASEQDKKADRLHEVLVLLLREASADRKLLAQLLLERPEPQPEWLTLKEAAAYIAYGEDWIYRHAGEIGGKQAKKGGRWMFRRSALDAWMERESNLDPDPPPSLPARRRRKRQNESADLIPYETKEAA